MFLNIVQTSIGGYYCIRLYTTDKLDPQYSNIFCDKRIAKVLGIDYEEYKNKFLNDFNAFESNNENFYFNSENNAKKAIEWLEPYLVAKMLVGDK